MFLTVPVRIASKAKDTNVLTEFSSQLDLYKMRMVIHGSYTVNLCQPHTVSKYRSSIKSLVQDLNGAHIIGKRCLGVIIHMGKNVPENHLTEKQAINNYVYGLEDALKQSPTDTTIILETGASQGSEVASKIEGLSYIYHKLTSVEQARVMFCIDTCHIWATGYDISNAAGVKKFFDQFDKSIGLQKIACIHFNDSRTALNSHVDRHADLSYGFIKSPGLRAVAVFAKEHNLPLITETPLEAIDPKTNADITMDDELDLIRSWI